MSVGKATTNKAYDQRSAASIEKSTGQEVSRCAGLMAFAQQRQQDGAWANKSTHVAKWKLPHGFDAARNETSEQRRRDGRRWHKPWRTAR